MGADRLNTHGRSILLTSQRSSRRGVKKRPFLHTLFTRDEVAECTNHGRTQANDQALRVDVLAKKGEDEGPRELSSFRLIAGGLELKTRLNHGQVERSLGCSDSNMGRNTHRVQ